MATTTGRKPNSSSGTSTGGGSGINPTDLGQLPKTRRRGRGRGIEVNVSDAPETSGIPGRPPGKSLSQKSANPSAYRDAEAARKRAFEKLGTPPPAPAPVLPFEATLAYVFRTCGGKLTAINAARLLEDSDVRFKRFVHAFDSATARDQETIRLEDLCAAAELTPGEFLGSIIPALFKRSYDIARIVAAISHPKIVDATIEAAQRPQGFMDRQMLHQHAGFLPLPKGQTINIDSRTQTINATAGMSAPNATSKVSVTVPSGLPTFESDGIELIGAVRGDASANSVPEPKLLEAPLPTTSTPRPATPEVIDAEIEEAHVQPNQHRESD